MFDIVEAYCCVGNGHERFLSKITVAGFACPGYFDPKIFLKLYKNYADTAEEKHC